MNGLIVFLAIIFISTMIGAISNWLRKQQQVEEERRRAQQRAANPKTKSDGLLGSAAAEIEKLNQRRPGPAPVAEVRSGRAAVVQAKPVRRPLVLEVPVVKPVQPEAPVKPPAALPPAAPVGGVSPARGAAPPAALLPEASVLAPPPPLPGDLTRPILSAGRGSQATSARAPQLLALLRKPEALPMAVVLTEILGTPKCHATRGPRRSPVPATSTQTETLTDSQSEFGPASEAHSPDLSLTDDPRRLA